MAVVAEDNMLRVSRTFDAPPERVFAAWTDPKQFADWFGPEGVTTLDCSLDVRDGGAWRLLGQGAQRRHAISGRYVEVAPPQRLRFTWAWHENGDPAAPREHETVVTIEFKAVGRRTQMTLVHGPFRDRTGVDNHDRGWSGSFAKLDRHLARLP